MPALLRTPALQQVPGEPTELHLDVPCVAAGRGQADWAHALPSLPFTGCERWGHSGDVQAPVQGDPAAPWQLLQAERGGVPIILGDAWGCDLFLAPGCYTGC